MFPPPERDTDAYTDELSMFPGFVHEAPPPAEVPVEVEEDVFIKLVSDPLSFSMIAASAK